MKKIIITLISTAILMTNCGGSAISATSEPTEKPKTPEELKAELIAHEKTEPLTYLTVNASMRADQVQTREEGFFHSAEYSPDGNTIHGTIKNTSTMAKFKDIVLTVTYYSQTETAIESKDFVIYEFYVANSTTPFELKVHPPATMKKFGVQVKNAVATN